MSVLHDTTGSYSVAYIILNRYSDVREKVSRCHFPRSKSAPFGCNIIIIVRLFKTKRMMKLLIQLQKTVNGLRILFIVLLSIYFRHDLII